jgi:uncharacterized coiled-coil DUF342 family protein
MMQCDDLRREVREVKESLESIHHRLDKFHSWAAQLQMEYRGMQQRLRFIEGNTERGCAKAEDPIVLISDAELMERLSRIKGVACGGGGEEAR